MMHTNEEVATALDRESKLLAIQQANPFRIRAYRNVANTIRKLARPLSKMVAEGEDLSKLPTIGKDLSHQIEELLVTGTSSTLRAAEQMVSSSLIDLLDIPGLGPVRVNTLNRSLGIETRSQLERALLQGRVAALPGFGSRLEQALVKTIGLSPSTRIRMLLSEAEVVAESLLRFLESCSVVDRATACGSLRRGKPTIGDLDIVLESKSPEAALREAAKYEAIATTVMEGATRSTYLLNDGVQVDMRAVQASEVGAALVYLTGNKTHNIKLRQRAKSLGYKLNEYGLFDGEKNIAGRSEKAIYSALKLQYIPPELRRGTNEIEKARANAIPKLIVGGDINGDFHIVLRNGASAQKALITKLREMKFAFAGVIRAWRCDGHDSDHQVGQIRSVFRAFDTLTGRASKPKIFKGLKVVVPRSGEIHLPDDLLNEVDYLIAAVEDDFALPRAKQTARILRAMAYPKMRILSHPLCRELNLFPGLSLDVDRIFEASLANNCWLEINGDPRRLDLPAVYCRRAAKAGVTLCFGSSALTAEGSVERLRYATTVARRGWMGPDNVINCCSPASIASMLSRKPAG